MAQTIKNKQISIISDFDINTHKLINVVDPINNQDVATKYYVDAVAQGVSPHAPVRVVSTGQTTLEGTPSVDDVTLTDGNFVLVAGQTDKTQNGIYTVHSGAGWTRRPDADGNPTNEVELGDFVFVESGTTNNSTGWVLSKTTATGSTINPGVDTQEWYKMAAPGTYSTDGEGIVLEGSQFKLVLSGDTLSKGINGLKLNDTLSTAISSNTTNLSTEISTRSSDDYLLLGAISTEVSNRNSADGLLSTAISTEASIRESTDMSLSTTMSSVDDMTLNIANGDLLYLNVDTISGTTNLMPSLSTVLSTEISERISSIDSLSTVVSMGGPGGATALSGLTDVLLSSQTDNDILVYSSGIWVNNQSLTGITSLSTAIISGNESLSTAISINLSTTNESLSTAISTNISTSDDSLSTAISISISTSDESLSTVIISSDQSLSTDISTNLSTSNESLSTAISTNISISDDSLSTAISIALSTSDESLSTVIISSDQSLSTDISTNLSTTNESLSTAISTNISISDDSLSTAISINISTGNDSLSTVISSAMSLSDESLSTVIISSDQSLSTDISTNLSTSNESLSTAISTNISISDDSLSTAISINISTGNDSLSNAISNAMSISDESLSTVISTTVSTGIDSLSTTISTDMSTDISTAVSEGLDSLSTTVSTEISTSYDSLSTVIVSSDQSLSTDISTNLSTSNESLSTAISTNISTSDDSLSTAISIAMSTSDESLSTVIISSDQSLSTDISTNLSTTNESLSTAISTNISTSDDSLSTAISINISTGNDSLSTAISTSISISDESLSTVVSTEINSLSTTVSTEVSTNIGSLSTVISNLALDDLSDVIATSPSEGDVLYRISGQWQNSNILSVEISDRISADESLSTAISSGGPGGSTALSGLTDVSLASVVNNDLLIFSGSTWVNQPNLWTVSNSAVTLSNPNFNLQLSNLEMPENGGALTLIDMSVTSGASYGTEESYGFNIDTNPIVRVYSQSNASGSTMNTGLVLDGDYYYAGEPTTSGSWRWFVNSNGDLEFQKFIGGVWVYKSKFT